MGPAPPRAPFCVCQRSVALPIGGPRAGPGLSAWQMAEPPPVCQAFYLTALKRRAGPLVPRVPGYLAAADIKLGGKVRRLGERRTEPRGRTNGQKQDTQTGPSASTSRPLRNAQARKPRPIWRPCSWRGRCPPRRRQTVRDFATLNPQTCRRAGQCPRLLFRGLSAWPSSVSGACFLRGVPLPAGSGLDRPAWQGGKEEISAPVHLMCPTGILCGGRAYIREERKRG